MGAHAEVRILTGARAGLVFPLSAARTVVGRHPEADLRFSPEGDLDVSALHAEIVREEGGWVVRDLGSRNGTWVNGVRAAPGASLREGDRISFGADGPAAEFGLRPRGPRRTSRARWAVAGMVALLVAVAGSSLVAGRARSARWEEERSALRLQVDSIRRAEEGRSRLLQERLAAVEDSLRRPLAQLREPSGRAAPLPAAGRGVASPAAGAARRPAAAGLDVRAVQRATRPAVALIYVESQAGEVVTATAFAVRRDAVLVTNRHVVAGDDGMERPRRIAVQFSGSEQVWPARLLAVSEETDLALVKVDNILGEVPTVRALNLRADTLRQGSPVAIIGFPLGRELQAEGRIVRPLLFMGALRGVSGGRVEVEGYGAAGASGSPILDANGDVVGVLFGGRPRGADPLVYGAPASAAARLLEGVP